MKKLVAALFFVLCAPCLIFAADLASLDQAGLTTLLEKNRGKVIMLNFFATWCPPCKAEIPEIVKLRSAWPEDKLLIVGLSVDEKKADVPPFLNHLKVNYPVYLASREITDKYNVTSVPHNAFITPAGQLIISEPGMADEAVLQQVVTDLSK